MTHVVFKIGPLEQGAGDVYAYFVYPGDVDHRAFFGHDDSSVLSEILGVYSPAELACEPQLSAAASPLGIASRELTPDEAKQIGVMAFELAFPGQFNHIHAAAFFQLAAASKLFFESAPWNRPFARQTIGIAATGSVKRRLSARILGSKGASVGLALYPSSQAIDRIIDLFEAGKFEEAADIETLGLSLENGPPFAIDAMRRAYGLPKLPAPLKIEAGKRARLDDLDFLLLAAALRAVSVLSSENKESNSQVRVGESEILVMAYLL